MSTCVIRGRRQLVPYPLGDLLQRARVARPHRAVARRRVRPAEAGAGDCRTSCAATTRKADLPSSFPWHRVQPVGAARLGAPLRRPDDGRPRPRRRVGRTPVARARRGRPAWTMRSSSCSSTRCEARSSRRRTRLPRTRPMPRGRSRGHRSTGIVDADNIAKTPVRCAQLLRRPDGHAGADHPGLVEELSKAERGIEDGPGRLVRDRTTTRQVRVARRPGTRPRGGTERGGAR